jgi:L-malate glycosyltransferase
MHRNGTFVMNENPSNPIRIGFVLHMMQVAGAEMLVAAIIRQLKPLIDPVIFCLDGVGSLGESLIKEQVPVVNVGRHPGLDIRVAGRLADEINAHRCEVVHAHQYTPFFYAALAKPLVRRRYHLMFTEHGRHYPDVVSCKRYWSNRILLSSFANEVNAVCEFSAKSLNDIEGFCRKPIQIIPNGIEPDRYHLAGTREEHKACLGLDPKLRYIGCIARFHPVKGHAALLRAFADVARSRKDVELLLVGGGPLRDALERQASGLGIANRVQFLGIRNDVPAILNAVDVFTLTSISEAASLTLLEAMASSAPVVVTDVGGNGEIVRDGVEGYLVPRDDSSAIAHACLNLLENPQKAKEMGENGRIRVEQHYKLEETIEQYYQRYENAAKRIRHNGRIH